ncbi:MAG: glycosyltransferase family 2 protein [Deltaproteobacteria bacterium]|nr:glycosyltransferase family 2 protein [Deltaproteobacteria bacterium]
MTAFLSVVVPAYNEACILGSTIPTISKYLKAEQIDYEYVFVDDGSTDGTADVLMKLTSGQPSTLLRNDRNMGKGFSVQRGMLHASGEYVLFTDADLSTPIEMASELLRWAQQGYDVVIGSRRLPTSKTVVHQPRYRELLGEVFYWLVRVFILPQIRDTNCGFKLFRRDVARAVFRRQTLRRWGFDVETLFIATKLGLSIREVPVSWYNVRDTKVRLIQATLETLGELARIKLNDWKGLYE